jgi:peptide/nickel transport system permease protein
MTASHDRHHPQRLLSALPILVIVSLITFAMIHLIPGDPAAAIAGLSATPEADRQYPAQSGPGSAADGAVGRWYGNLLHGDLGRSLLLGSRWWRRRCSACR